MADYEKDALTGLGHACGHNLIAVASVGAALATAEVAMKRELGGKVVLFGTPAEGKSKCIAMEAKI
jgi:metal-dependent amidase/aminoacylase/carboxypeptidase family protein